MKKPKPPKRHHYVTESYLKGFSRKKSVTGKGKTVHHLAWHDKHEGKIKFVSTKDVMAEMNLYTFTKKDGSSSTAIEEKLAELEAPISATIAALGIKSQLQLEARADLCVFLAYSIFRTPSARQRISECSEASILEVLEGAESGPGVSRSHMIWLMLATNFIDQLARRQWCVIHSTTVQTDFITSDCPFLAVSDGISTSDCLSPSLADPQTELIFPLTKTCALNVCGVGFNDHLPHIEVSIECVQDINSCLAENAHRFTIGSTTDILTNAIAKSV